MKRVTALAPFDVGDGAVAAGRTVSLDDDAADSLINAGAAVLADPEFLDGLSDDARAWLEAAAPEAVEEAIRLSGIAARLDPGHLTALLDLAATTPPESIARGLQVLPALNALAETLSGEQLEALSRLTSAEVDALLAPPADDAPEAESVQEREPAQEQETAQEPSPAEERRAVLLQAARGLDRTNTSLFKRDGVPKVSAMEAASGLTDVTADEVATIWAEAG